MAAPPRLALFADLSPGSGSVCGLCQLSDDGKELPRLPDEQLILGECPGRARRGALGLGRPDDRDGRELPLQERRRLGQDQVRLGQLAVGVQVREHQPGRGVGQRRRVAGFVLPGLEVHDLAAADAEQDSKHFLAGDPLRQGGVEARAALLDEGEVEAGRVGDRLQVVGIREVTVVAGNRRMLADGERRDGLRQGVAEVGVERVAAVARLVSTLSCIRFVRRPTFF